jgi:hypothetical protein
LNFIFLNIAWEILQHNKKISADWMIFEYLTPI